jgi:hypothetical protein
MQTLRHSRKTLAPVLALAGLSLVTGCGGGGSSSHTGLVAQGVWGSAEPPGPQMTVTSTGATFSDSSGMGQITSPITSDASGKFDVTGTYGASGIPTPGGYPTFPARYTGGIDGKTMTLTVTITAADGTTSTKGPFTLTYGNVVGIVYPV